MAKNPEENLKTARFPKAAAPGKRETPAPESYWQSFPRMEKLLGEERPPMLAQIEATCRRLDAILKSGSKQETARAQTAMNGYARALELYRYLAKLRDETWADSNKTGAANDK